MKSPGLTTIVRSVITPAALAAAFSFATSLCSAQTNQDGLGQRLKAYHFGQDSAVLESASQAVSDARIRADRKPAVARELASVLASDAVFDAKQFACRQLAFVAGDEQIPALEALLPDELLGHYALIALARIPGANASEAILRALSKTKGRNREEIMDALGERRDVTAVAPLSELLGSSDPAMVESAATGLSKIANALASAALRTAYQNGSSGGQVAIGHALVTCAQRMAGSDRAEAIAIYRLLDRSPAQPIFRAAALRGEARIRGEQALPDVIKALSEDGTPRQSAAAVIAREVPGRAATLKICDALPALSNRGKLLALQSLADRGDASAAPAVLGLAKSTDSNVRAAAIRAVGALGDASSVPGLLQAAASGAADEQEAARESLAQLHGVGVDAKLAVAVGAPPAQQQIEAINALGARRTASTAALPQLTQAAGSSTRTVSAAAFKVLRDSSGPREVPELLRLMLSKPPGQRDEAIEAVSEAARRGTDEPQRTGSISERYSQATNPADRGDLLTILAQVGGPSALAILRKAESDTAPVVRSSALHLLAEWPTDEPISDLFSAAAESKDPTEKSVALRGAIRLISVNEQRSTEDAVSLYRKAIALSSGDQDSRLVLSGLTRLHSLEALKLIGGYTGNAAVRPEVELATVEIGRSIAGAYRESAKQALEPIATGSPDEGNRTKAKEALALIAKLGDYVTAWEVSPAYQQDGADYTRLFDIRFPAEERDSAKPVGWRVMPIGGSPDQPWLLDLLALYGGEQKVAYLRTEVWSDTNRDMLLEAGSDDGIKVWLNSEQYLAKNVARAAAPGQDKVTLHLKSGWNRLLLKITQNNQGWAAIARIANPDGTLGVGLKFRLPSDAAAK